MNIHSIYVQKLEILFKHSFKHSAATRTMTETVWVTAESEGGLQGQGESCPRSYVTQETIDSANHFLFASKDRLTQTIHSLEDLRQWVIDERTQIDKNPAAWCALELALLDLLARSDDCPVEKLLGLPELKDIYRYSAVLGDSEEAAFNKQLDQYINLGFNDFKIKISGDLARDRTRLARLNALDATSKVRIDANNLWRDASQVVDYVQALDFPVWAVEEPLEAGDFTGLAEVIRQLDKTRIILDESFLCFKDFDRFSPGDDWIINLRVSKMGGLLRSLEIIDQVKRSGIGLILGSQVGETSLLTRAALALATYTGEYLLAQEGAFGTYLLDRDTCTPSLMFGKSGILDIAGNAFTQKSGWGLSVQIK